MKNIFILPERRSEIKKRMSAIRRKRTAKIDHLDGTRYVSSSRIVQTKEYGELGNELVLAEQRVNKLSSNLKYVYPLTPKTILQYREDTFEKVVEFYEGLSMKEKSQFFSIQDNKLVNFAPDQPPVGKVSLETRLKPYYSKELFSVEEVTSELSRTIEKLKKSVLNSKKNGQKARASLTSRYLRKLIHNLSIIDRLNKKFSPHGRKLKGVDTQLVLGGTSYQWPKYIIGDFKSCSFGSSIQKKIEVNNTVSLPTHLQAFPALEAGRFHLFFDKSYDALKIMDNISEHEWRKFRPFNHYEKTLSKEYPSKNSITFPFDFFY